MSATRMRPDEVAAAERLAAERAGGDYPHTRALLSKDGAWIVTCPLGCGNPCAEIRAGRGTVSLTCSSGCEPSAMLAALEQAPAVAASGNGTPGKSKRKATLRHLDVARMVREDPPAVPWIVEGLVAKGMLSVLNGREGEGKSLLAEALGAGVASGQDEAGLTCRQGRVVIVDAENGEGEIHRRVHTLELPSEGVDYFEAEGFDLRSNLGELEAVLEAHRPDLLVLDSYRSLWGGEENDSREVAAVLDPLRNLVRRYDAGTLLLHHSGKTNGGYRGSSAIGASAELGFTLMREEDDPDRTRCVLTCWKARPCEKPPKRWLRLAVERGRVFIDAAEPPEEEAEATRPSPVREELRPRVLAVLGDEPLSRADIARAVGREPKDRSVGRVLDDLARGGEAERDGAGWRGVAGWQAPIGGAPLVPPPDNPQSRAVNRGGKGSATEAPRATPLHCACRLPARSPRASGPDVCAICQRPIAPRAEPSA